MTPPILEQNSPSEVYLTRAEARLEQKKRSEEAKLLYYKPCCRAHRNHCPSYPCPDSKHSKFHLSMARIRILLGGNRSGKTILGLNELLMMACFKSHLLRKTANPVGGRFRIYSSDFGIVEKMILPLIREWIPRQSLLLEGKTKGEAWENSYDTKYHILYLKGNVTIDFMSYDQESSKSESVELDGIWGDEEMPEDIFSACLARLVSRSGIFWMTVTPLYRMSWAMKFMDNLDPQVEVFQFDIYDNPYNSDKSIKEFESSMPEHEKEARLHGRFLELQGLVYKELRQDIHLIKDCLPEPGNPVIFALDPHPRKPSVMTWSYVTSKGDIVFFDELEIPGTARDIVSAIRAKESQHPAQTLLRLIDPAARKQSPFGFETDTLQEFEREGMGFTLADNSEAGYNIVHEYLTFDASRPLSSLNRPRCFFTRGVPRTWYGMTHLLWDDWTFKKDLKDDKERVRDYKKDFPDAVRYTLAQRPSYRSFAMARPVPTGNMLGVMNFNPDKNVVRQAILGGR